jgi:hypothetical protein
MLVVRITFLAALAILAGCSASSGGSPPGSRGSLTPSSEQPSRIPEASPPAGSGQLNLPASVVDPVVAEIARLANVSIDQVTVRSAEPVTFPDAGLGCPQPGMAYTQVMTDGFKVVAEAGGTTYDFRGTAADLFRRCTTP